MSHRNWQPRSEPSQAWEFALLVILVMVSLFAITVSFYEQGRMVGELEHPIESSFSSSSPSSMGGLLIRSSAN